MSSLFYHIQSDRYDTEDGPHDCQILRLFTDKAHWELWKSAPEDTRPIDTVECSGGRVCPETHSYLGWALLDNDEAWLQYAKEEEAK